ncbi:MAG: hypothetical protein HY678_12510 [Chloroflexi bacterium]|nr:hypothetical protein [Chloroflexota bacterium]
MRWLTRASQGGYLSLTIGMLGLVMCGAIAAPLVARAATALRAQETSSPVGSELSGVISAAEHGLWRIENDTAFLSGMTGSPPSSTYTLDLPEGTATITVTQSSDPPGGDGLNLYLTVTPNLVQPNTATTVTYTIRAVNNSSSAQSIDRVEADPQSFNPTYVANSTTGFTTAEPTYTAGAWRWNVVPAVLVPPFASEVSMSWQMQINQNEGDYFVAGSARFVNVGTVTAPMTSSVRVASMNDIDVGTTVTPPLVSAGNNLEFEYTITITNNAISTRTIDWVKHYTGTEFNHLVGSTSGFTTADPQRNSDGNGRWEYSWNVSVPIPSGQSRQLVFDMNANLVPGTYYAESKMRAEEDTQANGQEATATSGNTAPVLAVRIYRITAVLGGREVTVDASLDNLGVTITSWTED